MVIDMVKVSGLNGLFRTSHKRDSATVTKANMRMIKSMGRVFSYGHPGIFTKANSSMIFDTVTVKCTGLMDLITRECGSKANNTEKENYIRELRDSGEGSLRTMFLSSKKDLNREPDKQLK